ncbi:MAG: bifunctional DNA primase/polymerase [Gemmataceae bacterium]|nr:bifunctional DNA primase/polymerase [Gemmataceae bacterium]
MNEHPDTPGNLDAALAAAEKGLAPIPCHPGTKVPCVKWKEWQGKLPPRELIERWFQDARRNLAIVTTGMAVFDCDDPEKADLVLANCGETSHKLKTPRGGIHLGYRRRKGVALGNQVKIKGLPIDIRTDGGLEVIPPSETEQGRYEWLTEGLQRIDELPLARVAWTRQRSRRRAQRTLSAGDLPVSQSDIRNPESYCRTIVSIQGQNGSARLVRVVCVLRDAGRTPEQAWGFLLGWNETNAIPPWSESELRHALQRHYHL